MTDVLFLNPPRRADGSNSLFNNATLTLASYLHKRGVSTQTCLLQGAYWLDELNDLLQEHQPATVAISCKWWDTLFGATELARMVKKYRPEAKVVSGGQTATAFAGELVEYTHFDAVIRGDGEKPLLEFAQGRPSCNLTLKDGTMFPTTYVQNGKEDLRLLEDLSQVAESDLLEAIGFQAPFVWTGKGCRCTCMFCAGSALGHKRLFGRKGYMYRSFDRVLHDIEVLGSWSRDSLMFDFDPIADPGKADYYAELFQQLPENKYHLTFYCWSLPEPSFVELLIDRFRSVHISLDAQTYSEALRKRLGEKRQLKPFSPNRDFEEILNLIKPHPHLDAGVYGILGLAGEKPEDVVEGERWIEHLLTRYGDTIGELGLTPLSMEPGALLDRDPDKYNMVATRRGFQDYMEFTKLAYQSTGGFHEAPYDANLPHPYGCYSKDDRPDRLYHDYHRIHDRVQATFEARNQAEASQSIRYFPRHLELKMRNRNRLRDRWHLITWAANLALDKKLPEMVIDAREAFVSMPRASVLAKTGLHQYTLKRLPGLAGAIESGRLKLRIKGRPGQAWEAMEEIGAIVEGV